VVAAKVGSPVAQSLSSPAYATPLDTVLTLQRSDYALYELTGHTSGGGGITFTQRRAASLAPADVQVIGPDGIALSPRGPGSGTETLTRGQDIFTVAVYFTVPRQGSYHVLVNSGQVLHVVISRSMASGLQGVKGKVGALLGGVLILVVGAMVLVVALIGRHRRRAAGAGPRAERPAGLPQGQTGAPMQAMGSLPPPGWHLDPDGTQQWRWWDGRAWAPVAVGRQDAQDPQPRGAGSGQ
jgi:hypothetical protein